MHSHAQQLTASGMLAMLLAGGLMFACFALLHMARLFRG
jgi:hypothetical protein